MWTLYLIKCKTPNYFYVGITTDLKRRLTQHQCGDGAKFTKQHGVSGYKIIKEDIINERDALFAENNLVTILSKRGYWVSGGVWVMYNINNLAQRDVILMQIPQHWPWCKHKRKELQDCSLCNYDSTDMK